MRTKWAVALFLGLSLSLAIPSLSAEKPKSQDKLAETLETRLGLKALESVDLLGSTSRPPIGIRAENGRGWNGLLGRDDWEVPVSVLEPQGDPNAKLEKALYKNPVDWTFRLHEKLAKTYTGGVDTIELVAAVATENGEMFMAKVETSLQFVGKKRRGNVVYEEFARKAAQIRIYRNHPELLEIRFYAGVLRKEILPPQVKRLGKKPREFAVIKQVGPTLIATRTKTTPANQNNPVKDALAAKNSPTGLLFDGTDDQVEIPSLSNLEPPLTLEAVVFPKTRGLGKPILAFDNFELSVDVRPKHILRSHDRYADGEVLLTHDGVRHHVSLTWDGSRIVKFVDGARVREQKYDRKLKGTLRIGTVREKRWWGGNIEQVRISKAIQYKDDFEVPERLSPNAETLALYHFEAGEGGKLMDASGNDHHGVIHGASWVSRSDNDAPNHLQK